MRTKGRSDGVVAISRPIPRPSHPALAPTGAVTLAFFASRAAGLIFEMVWFYQASLVVGNTVWAASIVVSSFLAGLGLGGGLAGWRSSRMRSPLRMYAALEISVAATGLLVAYALPKLSRALAPVLALMASTLWLLAATRLTSGVSQSCGRSDRIMRRSVGPASWANAVNHDAGIMRSQATRTPAFQEHSNSLRRAGACITTAAFD